MSGAKDYAEALLSLTDELGTTNSALEDVRAASKALTENPEYAKLADTPALSVHEKLSLIERAFSSVDESVRNLLKILCEKHSVHIFPRIASEYVSLYNESRGICNAEVISAIRLSEPQMAALKKKLKEMTGKTIVLRNTIDKSVLGGIKLRYMGKQLDGSLRSRLDAIESTLKNTIL